MSLQDDLLEAIRPHGIELARLYFRFRELGQERVDYALQGLFEAGEIYRSNNHALPRTAPLQYRCSQCHELRTIDRMMETGVCLHCLSDSMTTIEQSFTKTCPRCGAEFSREGAGDRTYCVSCNRAKNAEYHARDRAGARLRDRKKAAASKSKGTTKTGVPTWDTLQRMTRMDSALPGASRSGSR